MRVAVLLLVVSACARPPAPGTAGQPRGQQGPAPEVSLDSAVPGEVTPVEEVTPVDAGGSSSVPEQTIPEQTVPDFEIWAPRTDIWVATASGCLELSFDPRDAESGRILVGPGLSIDYRLQGDMLDLGPISQSEGDGLASRHCQTGLRLGPGMTLGGATVFDDEASCTAAYATARPLDDSPEATVAKCRGEVLPVTTEEIWCGVGERYAILAGEPGCISVAMAGRLL